MAAPTGRRFARRRLLLQGEPGEVLVFSDEAGPENLEAARLSWSSCWALGLSVIPVSLEVEVPRNLSIVRARYGEGLEGGRY